MDSMKYQNLISLNVLACFIQKLYRTLILLMLQNNTYKDRNPCKSIKSLSSVFNCLQVLNYSG
jgi:hypothetical protein